MDGLHLHGYAHSVYSWIARLILAEKDADYVYHEVDPFADPLPAGYLDRHPFRRVPVLEHNGFRVYETAAIGRYLDAAFSDPPLEPADARGRARVAQVVSIADSYAYWPLVRQVFVHGYYNPIVGEPVDANELERGLKTSRTVLHALESLVGAHPGCLIGNRLSLADFHLFAMLEYFSMAAAGADILAAHPHLADWHVRLSDRPSILRTRPAFTDPD